MSACVWEGVQTGGGEGGKLRGMGTWKVCENHRRQAEGEQGAGRSRGCREGRYRTQGLPGSPGGPSPLRHDLEGVRQVALHVLHLERVSVADLVVRAPVIGVFHHDDVTARAPQLDGVAFARQLPAHQPKRESSPAQACGEGGGGERARYAQGAGKGVKILQRRRQLQLSGAWDTGRALCVCKTGSKITWPLPQGLGGPSTPLGCSAW